MLLNISQSDVPPHSPPQPLVPARAGAPMIPKLPLADLQHNDDHSGFRQYEDRVCYTDRNYSKIPSEAEIPQQYYSPRLAQRAAR